MFNNLVLIEKEDCNVQASRIMSLILINSHPGNCFLVHSECKFKYISTINLIRVILYIVLHS